MKPDEIARNFPTLIDKRAAAGILSVTPRTVTAWVRDKKIGYCKLGRAIRFDPSELQRFIQERTFQATRKE